MKFGNFEFQPETDRLGEGPQSEVFRAVDTRLGRTVALKILRPHVEFDPEAVTRFEREAKHTSALEHPNIATIYEYGDDRGNSYIAMEFLEGRALDKIIAERPLSYEEGLRVGLQVTAALELVHDRQLIHRDLKPANVMVLPDGTVKLLDFGICRSASETNITQEGMLVGTVLYMSPEQVRGQDLDLRSDVFAFGALFYHALTGNLPFNGRSFPEVCMAILDGKVARPSELRQGFPPALERVILRCLEPDPADRYPNGGAVRDALMAVAAEVKASSGGSKAQELRGEVLLPRIETRSTASNTIDFAAGVRRDLARELSRSTKLEVELVDGSPPRHGESGTFLLTARLELDDERGAVEFELRRMDLLDQPLSGRTEHTDADEWGLQGQIVRALARAIRRGVAELAARPAEAAARDPERARKLAASGHAVLHRGTTKHLMAAIATFRRALEDDPACALAYAGLAEAMVRKFLYWDGDRSFLGEAVDAARRALALDPACAEAHTSLGFAHAMSGSAEDALREYRQAIQLDRDEWLAHRFMGAILARQGNYKAAEEHLERASSLWPANISTWDHWYNCLIRQAKNEAALDVGERGIEAALNHLAQQPDDQDARIHLALLLARLGSFEEARTQADTARRRAPKDGFTLFNIGCVLALTGDEPAAMAALEESQARGYYVRSELWSNTDLDTLRELPRFRELAG
ncbi:MAG: protein kinase domain-containing protein [Planctomycetota bacterium]|jgi:serine/threonine protein kinase/Flp pilus assembly protein TadD